MKRLLILASALAFSAPLVAAGPDNEAKIGQVDKDAIADWDVFDNQTIYARTRTDEWYVVHFDAPCTPLDVKGAKPYFMPDSHGEFQKGGTVRFKKETCTAASVMKSGPPQAKPKAKPAQP